MVSTASGIATVAKLIGQSGGTVQNLFNTHSSSYTVIEQHINTIITHVSTAPVVHSAATSIQRVNGVSTSVADLARRIEEEAAKDNDSYNSTRVLAIVSEMTAELADQNATILNWLTTLNPSS